MRAGLFTAAFALCLSPAVQASPAAPAEKGKSIDVAICLDTSNSMDGLIDSAKRKLWAIVNDLAKIDPAPTLRVALYSYGNNAYDPKKGWVRKDVDLTTDLDEVYKQLNALRTFGGEEYVARVTRDAIADLKWCEDKDALRIIFVCGNEPVNQDKEVSLESVASTAKSKNILINTIYAGPANHSETAGWKEYALLAGGRYTNIDQDQNTKQSVVKTPFDEELQKLATKINETYCWYGAKGAAACENQKAQDENAAKNSKEATLERGVTKAGRLYKNAEADLIDRMQSEKGFDLKKIKEEDLPEELKKLKPEEREAYLKKKAADRAEIQKKIADLGSQRAKFIEEERKKEPKSAADKAFDEALRSILKEQTAAKGMKIQ